MAYSRQGVLAAGYRPDALKPRGRILREALLGPSGNGRSFEDDLLSMPNVGEGEDFERGPQIECPYRAMSGLLLDTNVLSELRKEERCDPGVRQWTNV